MTFDSAYIIQAIAYIFFAGVLTSKVWSHEKRLDNHEAKAERIEEDLAYLKARESMKP